MNRIMSCLKEKDELASAIPFLCRSVVIVLVIGILLRLIVGFFMTSAYDIYHWGIVIENIESGNAFYEITGYFYTPGWGYVLSAISFLQNLLGVDIIGERITSALPIEDLAWHYTATITTPAFNMVLKAVIAISDLIVGYLIFWIIRDRFKDQRKALMGFAMWFLCPLMIGAGSAIVMFDSVSVMLTLLSVILLTKKQYLPAGIILSIATMIKFFPGFLFFVFIGYILLKSRKDGNGKQNVALFIAGIVLAGVTLFLPTVLDGTFSDCFLFLTSRVGNGWGLGILDVVGSNAAIIVYVLCFVSSIIIGRRISKADGDDADSLLYDGMMVVVAVMFLYPPLPQYVLLLMPFVIFAVMSDRKYLKPWCVIAIGSSVTAFAGGAADLLSIGAFTDIIGMDAVMSMINAYTTAIVGPLSGMDIASLSGSLVQYIGVLLVLYARFGDRLRNRLTSRDKDEQAKIETQ